MKKIAALLLCAWASAASSEAANIIWVSFHPGDDTPSSAAAAAGFTRAPDVGYTERLRAAGHTVTRVLSSDLPNATQLNAADLVIISRSVPSGHYELDAETAAWNGITAPTLILGGYVIRDIRLGFTAGGTIPDTAGPIGLKVKVPGHPVFDGVSLDARGQMVNAYANVASVGATAQRGISVVTSPIATGGIVLATVGTATDPALGGMIIGEWLAGDTLATSPADTLGGHRMVLLTGSREVNGAPTSEISGVYDLTDDGTRIFLNAVNYLTGSRIAVHTVNTVNNTSPGAGETSLLQALSSLQDGDSIRFKIPGAGPHFIQTPIGGYPLITANSVNIDGYTQPGSSRNTNPILAANNAQIKIVLDSTGADTGENPLNPGRPLRRSTRLDFPNDVGNTGYGETENAVLGVYQADNVTISGLSILGRRTPGTETDPSIYGVALVRQALNARVQGCRFGLAPGAAETLAEVKPVAAAVAAFRWRIGGDVYSSGASIGTDGDGATDRGEFNVILGGRISLALELPNARISGNFVNVYPSGNTFLDLDANYQLWRDVLEAAGEDPNDVTLENFENGRAADNTVVGTNGDGLSDSDERNVFGHIVYDHAGEVYSAGTNLVIAGNYFGVGVDGVTPAPVSTNKEPDFVELPGGNASIRIGSNGDGVSDALEGNLIRNFTGASFCVSGSAVPIAARGNVFVNNHFAAIPFAEGANGRTYSAYYAAYVTDASANIPPVAQKLENNLLSGVFAPPGGATSSAFVDVYLLDPAGLDSTHHLPNPILHPSRLIASFRDNGPDDLNANPGEFSYNLAALGVTPSTYVAIAVTYSQDAGVSAAGRSVTTPVSNPVAVQPTVRIRTIPATEGGQAQVELWWFGPQGSSVLQMNDDLNTPENWFEPFGERYVQGRISVVLPFEESFRAQFFRVKVNP